MAGLFSFFSAKDETPAKVEAATVSGDLYNATGDYFESTVLKQLYVAITGNSSANYATVAQWATTPRGYTDMNQTKVTVNGRQFDVMYLTTSGNNVVLTLLASQAVNEVFNPNGASNSNGTNPGNMYSTSYVRASLLSGDGQARQYNNGPNALTSLTSATSLGNSYRPFTTGNFKKYILTPAEAQYQATENNYGRGASYTYSKGSGYNTVTLNNDAFGTPAGTVQYGSAGSYVGKANYTAWKDDLLWIPSLTEMGAGNAGGLWKTNSSFLNRGTYWMTRSATHDQYHRIVSMSGSSIFIFSGDTVNYTFLTYPAFHLNLTLAGAAVEPPEQVAANIPTYNDSLQTFDFTATGTNAPVTKFDSAKMEISGITRDGGVPTGYTNPTFTATSITVKEAGTYKVSLATKTLSSTTTQKWLFTDTNKDTTTMEFVVKKRQLTAPTFGGLNTNTKPYTGNDITFTASNPYSSALTAYPLTATVSKQGSSLSTPPPQTDNGGTLDIKVRDAGEYTATFSIKDSVNYEWSDGATGTKTAGFTVQPKQLEINYTTTVTGNALSWAANEDTHSATFVISGLIAGDSVGINLKFTKENDVTFPATTVAATADTDTNGDLILKAVIDKSTFGGAFLVGSYPITFEFDATTGTDNGNYSLDTALANWNRKLTIEASGAGLSSYNWLYSKDSGTAQAMPTDKKLSYAYNNVTQSNSEYRIELDTTGFTDAHIKIDDTKYTNGYDENVKDRAGTYTTKVALISTDPNYLFTLSDGTKSATMDLTYPWEITKGDIDLSNVKWVYTTTQGNIPSSPQNYPAKWDTATKTWVYLDENGAVAASDMGLPWYGENYTLMLTGFPTGVTITNPTNAYNGTNKKKFIGAYNTECVGITYDTTNYNPLPADVLKLDWSIVKAQIHISSTSWTTEQQGGTAGGMNLFYVPVLQNIAGVEYEYYDLGTNEVPIAFPGNSIGTVNDIQAEMGTEHYYYVVAKVKGGVSTDGTTLWTDAIELVDDTGGITENGTTVECAKRFMTGDSRTPVQVTLNGAPFTYNGKEHAILDDGSNNGELSIQVAGTGNNFAASNFTVMYYYYDENDPNHKGAPVDAGDPTKAPKDAGKYVIEIQLTSVAEENYYATAKYVEFEIKPFQLDMSQVKWGYIDKDGNEVEYDPTKPLQYELDSNRAPVEHKLIFIGLPRGDAAGDDDAKLLAQMFLESKLGEESANGGIFSFTENTKSSVGNYTAECAIGALGGNFRFGNLPAFITDDGSGNYSSRQDWRIIAREIVAPKNDDSATFSGDPYDLLALAGLNPDDLGVYYNINSFTMKNEFNETVTPDAPDAQHVVNAGEYTVTLELIDKSGTNVKWLVNGSPKLTNQSFKITIKKLKVTVSDWEGDGEEPYVPTDAEGNNIFEKYPGLVESDIYDMNDNPVEGMDWNDRWNERFKQRIKASAGNEGNIEFAYAEGVEEEMIFQRPDEVGNESEPIARPVFTGDGAAEDGTGKGLVFNGETQDFTPQNLEELKTLIEAGRIQLFSRDSEGNDTPVGLEYFRQRNAGTYTAVIHINGNYKWSDTNDKTDVVLTFEVKKAEVKGEWGTDESGMPILTNIPESLKDMLVYEYLDKDGNVVPAEKLTKGKDYTVSVKVKGEESGNITLLTDDGTEAEALESTFTVPGKNTLANMLGLPEDFPLIQVVLTILFTLLFIIFLIMWIKYHKEKKEAKEIIEQYEDLNV